MKREIIHILPRKVIGGAELLTFNLVNFLNKNGFPSKILYLQEITDNYLEPFEFTLGMRSYKSIDCIPKLFDWFLKRELNNENCLVHTHLPWSLYYSFGFIKQYQLKSVHTVHNSQDFAVNFPFNRTLNRALLNQFSAVIGISDAVTDNIRTLELTKPIIKTINNGIQLFESKKREPKSKLKLVTVGILKKQKGYDFALEIISELRDQVESYTIVGNGKERIKLEKLVEKLQLSEIVHFVGSTSSPGDFIYDSDVYLQPSRWEGFGLAALEALSTGIPVLGSDVPGMREVLGMDNAGVRLLQFGDLHQWVNQIKEIQGNKGIFDDAFVSNPLQAEKFNFKNMAKAYIDLYQSLEN